MTSPGPAPSRDFPSDVSSGAGHFARDSGSTFRRRTGASPRHPAGCHRRGLHGRGGGRYGHVDFIFLRSTPLPPQASTPQADSSPQAPPTSAPVQEETQMQVSGNYAPDELNAALQQAMESAWPPMSVDDAPTSSERSVRSRTHAISIARFTAYVEVNEDTAESRTWAPDGYFDAAQLQKGIETEPQAFEDFDVKEDVDVSHWTSHQKQDIIPMRWVHAQKTPVFTRCRLVAKGFK
eukprot:15466264-Alexandrium_andersonii.AAC.1